MHGLGVNVAKIIISADLLEELRLGIVQHDTAILATADGNKEIAVQLASGYIEPENDEEMQIVLEALREKDSAAPWLTSAQARELLCRVREQ